MTPLDHQEVGRYWDENAQPWTELSRAGFDVYRDHVNTPGFLAMLPEIRGLRGLDIGCGEGHNTRMLADRGALMSAIDISPTFIEHARSEELRHSRGISFSVASAVALPFPDASFDFATGFMSFMDIPETDRVLSEARRVIRPGGFLQFSITHPCFDTPHRKTVRDASGERIGIEVGGYFDQTVGRVDEWHFSAAPREVQAKYPKFRVPRFHRTLSSWLNLVIDSGFGIERINEPLADEELAERVRYVADTRIVAYFLHVLCRAK